VSAVTDWLAGCLC